MFWLTFIHQILYVIKIVRLFLAAVSINALSGIKLWFFVKYFNSKCESNLIFSSFQGLEDQLLSVIVKFERKELEEQRERLILETRYF